MGYFDNAIAEREYALEHSSGPWKKHKYIEKITKGAKTLYRYNITGKGYKEDAEKYNSRAETARRMSNEAAKRQEEASNKQSKLRDDAIYYGYEWQRMWESTPEREAYAKKRYNEIHKEMAKNEEREKSSEEASKSFIKKADTYEYKAEEAENDYYTKSLIGKGEALIKKLFGK